jgi:DNA-3-methyladenine glycosylase II
LSKIKSVSGTWNAKTAVRALVAADPVLARTIVAVGPFTLMRETHGTPFQTLARAIVNQQLSVAAGATILGRVKAALGGTLTPEAAAAAELEVFRGCGLSRAKAAALRDLAAKTLDGTIPGFAKLAALSDEEIIAHLTAVKGIGLWSAQMFLMFAMARPDILPTGDLGLRRGFQRVFKKREMPLPEQIEKRAERWRPWRSVASWYLWRAADGKP